MEAVPTKKFMYWDWAFNVEKIVELYNNQVAGHSAAGVIRVLNPVVALAPKKSLHPVQKERVSSK